MAESRVELGSNVCLVAPHWGENVASWSDRHQVLEVGIKRACRSKVRDDTSLDWKRVAWLFRCVMIGIELDQDVVELDVSMDHSMLFEMS